MGSERGFETGFPSYSTIQDTVMTDYDDDPGKPDQDITLQQTLMEMGQSVFPYPVRARTQDRDGFIRDAHNCLAVRIEAYSEKDGNLKTGVCMLAALVQYCL